jgi:hypothetical protein
MSVSNNRASLLSGLRTGGVRSTPAPLMPQTAAIGGSFQPPRFASNQYQSTLYEEGPEDFNNYSASAYGVPLTAVPDGRAPRFQQQQRQLLEQAQLAALGLAPGMAGMQGMPGAFNGVDTQTQMLNLQLMQAMLAQQHQAQQLQAEIAMQQQVALAIKNQKQMQAARAVGRMPVTAGPTQTAFEIPHVPTPDRFERNHLEDLTSAPMTAALGGKFGSRSVSTGLNPNAPTFKLGPEVETAAPVAVPSTPSTTVVISGGVSLGAPSTPAVPTSAAAPSKSESATSWRRGSNAQQPTRSNSPPKPISRQSPPRSLSNQTEATARATSPPATSNVQKYRPQPLRIKEAAMNIPSVLVENETGQSIYSTEKAPSPVESDSSFDSFKKPSANKPVLANGQATARPSQPLRQPRGPPAGFEELGLKNFASRVKRNASVPIVIHHTNNFVEAY